MDTIFIQLLGEAVDVWRPVEAEREGELYRIVDSPPEDEQWAFPSGSLVRCEQRDLAGGPALVAVEAA